MKQLRRYFTKRVIIDKQKTLKPAQKFTTDQKIRRQSRIIKEMLISPEEILNSGKKIVSIDTMNYYQILNMVDTEFNNFFSNREINVQNYSQYLQTLFVQKKPYEVQKAFQKMELYGLQPDQQCYIFLIQSYGVTRKQQKAEAMFDQALELFGWNIFLINSLLYAYRFLKHFNSANNLLQQARLKGIKPNVVCYINLILICINKRNFKKCWQLYEQAKEEKVEIDDFLLGILIGVCSETSDCEKALKMWDQMINLPDIRLTALHYNSLIKALSSRKDYCERALEIYEEMKFKKIQPNKQTFLFTLKAVCKLGNIAVAYELALQLRSFDFKVNPIMSFHLIKTYVTALKNPMLPSNLKDKYFKDSWTIINNLIELKQINHQNLNALIEIHIVCNRVLEAEEIVLPLFDTLNIYKTKKTYYLFFQNFYNKRELQSVFNLYNKLIEKDNNLISTGSLDIVLKSYFAVKDINKIIQLLDKFIFRGAQPKNTTLIEMSKSKNIPDAILFRMNKFPFILKRSLKKRRVYGEHVDIIYVEGKIRNKNLQKKINDQQFRNNQDQTIDEVTSNVDKMHVNGYDKLEDINEDDFENFDKDIDFKDYKDKINDFEDNYNDYEDDNDYEEDDDDEYDSEDY